MALVAGQKVETHVLLVAFAAQGHLNPLLRFGKRLTAKGLHVTLATTEVAREKMLSSNNNNASASTTATTTVGGIHIEFFSDGLSLDYDRIKDLDYYMDCLSKFGPPSLSNLIDNWSQKGCRKFSCIINNPFVPWVADVAAKHGIPCALLWIQPCSLYAIYYRFYKQLNAFPLSKDPNMTVQLPGLPLLQYGDLPSFVLPGNPMGSFTRLLSEVFNSMEKLKWVLGNSFYELEKDAVESMAELCPFIPVGPLVPSTLLRDDGSTDVGVDMWKPDETCINWLDKKPVSSVVYVSLGSLLVLSKKQMEEVALGLKNSNCSFLWVVKASDHPGKDEGVITGKFLEDVKEQGLVVKWCPQTEVLVHPAISCFITHCGWNSTIEAVAAGVPIICFPHWTDQPTNAKLVTDVFGTGIRFKADEDGVVSREEVERCIHEIREGAKAEEVKKRGAETRDAARKAVAKGGSSDRNIQMFIAELSGLDLTNI